MRKYVMLRFLNSTIPQNVIEGTKKLIIENFKPNNVKFGRIGTQGTRLIVKGDKKND